MYMNIYYKARQVRIYAGLGNMAYLEGLLRVTKIISKDTQKSIA